MEENSSSLNEILYDENSLDLNNLQLSSIPLINLDSVEEFYNCKKCYKLPMVSFNTKGKIIFKCKCENSENEEISYNKINEKIIGVVKDDETKKRLNCYCTIHKEKFQVFCINCEENKCGECMNECISHDHQLINLNSNVVNIKNKIKDMQKKIEEIKNDKGYKWLKNDHATIDDIIINLSDEQESEIINDGKNEITLNSIINDEKANDYSLLCYFEIIIKNYEQYPDFYHIYNLKNCYEFFILKFCPKEIFLKYKNDKKGGKIKLFGKKFVDNNNQNCNIVIIGDKDKENKEIELCEYYNLDKNENSDFIIVKLKEKKDKIIVNMSYMFHNCNALVNILADKTIWKTLNANNMSYMFYSCTSLESIPELISEWDTSEVTDMSYLFYGCSLLQSIPDLSRWNTKKLNNMNYIFYGCKSLDYIPKIDLTNIKNKQKIIHNESCEQIHNIAVNVRPFLKAIKIDERTFIKTFEALLDNNKTNLYDKKSPGYIHANDALIFALNVNDCANIDKNFELLLNSVFKEERNFYYIWYLLNKLFNDNHNNCRQFLTHEKRLKIMTNSEF